MNTNNSHGRINNTVWIDVENNLKKKIQQKIKRMKDSDVCSRVRRTEQDRLPIQSL
jgi:hypothetical protein